MKSNIKLQIFAAFFLLLFAFSAAARAENFQTIISNGSPSNRVDIAILGDGYTAAEMTKYQTDVQQFIQNVFAQEPYKEYQRYYNVHRIDVVSNQSGADHSDRTPQVFVDTALDAAYNCSNIQRLICVNTTKVNQVIARTLPASYFDVILILVNDAEYGGSGGSVAVASTHPAAVEIILHEVGHSFGLLADEYAGGGPSCNASVEPSEVNATRAATRETIKWNYWINAATPIPTTTTTAATPGLYVGAKYCDTGLYRPTYQSKMNVLGVPFEQINTEQHVKRIYNFVSPIDASSPTAGNITLATNQTQTFSVTTPLPFTHNLTISWSVDNQAQASGANFTLNAATLAPGSHTVRVNIADPTAFVRNDPQQLLTAARTWNVIVQASIRAKFDFDGDGKADVSVFRPSSGSWFVQQSTAGFTGMQFGVPTDKIVPADYDGDGKTDLGVYRDGVWYLQRSQLGFTGVSFGLADDVPAPADFDGDGKADTAVFRPSNGTWYLLQSTNGFTGVQFGANGDRPVPADFDGDGKTDIAVYRVGNWYINGSQSGFVGASFGISTDLPVPADYDGDGKADLAVFRPSDGTWYLQRSQAGFTGVQFGAATDLPAPADFDGDGKIDVAVFRDGVWYLNRSTAGFTGVQFGAVDDKPIPNAFVR